MSPLLKQKPRQEEVEVEICVVARDEIQDCIVVETALEACHCR